MRRGYASIAFWTSSRLSSSPSSPAQRINTSTISLCDMPSVDVISCTHISTTYSSRPLHPASLASAISETTTPARSGSAQARRSCAAPALPSDRASFSTPHLQLFLHSPRRADVIERIIVEHLAEFRDRAGSLLRRFRRLRRNGRKCARRDASSDVMRRAARPRELGGRRIGALRVRGVPMKDGAELVPHVSPQL